MSIEQHEQFLREKIFYTETKWPQYDLLLSDIKKLAALMPENSYVLSLERNKLYGGYSPFAPFFEKQLFVGQDNTPYENAQRGAYNNIEDPRRIFKASAAVIHREPDLIMVPNLIHHVADQKSFFERLARLARPGCYLYIFEPLFREIHQAPNDYVRYTPEGMAYMIRRHNFKIEDAKEIGGAFTVFHYILDQAKQYLPDGVNLPTLSIEEALALDAAYPTNQQRKHTRMCTAFSFLARKE